MAAAKRGEPIEVMALLGDPRLPYPYAPTGWFGEEELGAARCLEEAVAELKDYRVRLFDDHEALIDELRREPPELVLNLCDTGYRNDWELERNVPAFLEMLGIPYTGADPMGISMGTDKAIVRSVARELGVPVPNEVFVDLTADPPVMPSGYPALIKPNSSGGSFGITSDCVVHDAEQAEAYIRYLAGIAHPPEAVIQDFLTGPEYTVGLIGNRASGFTVLPPLEVDYSALASDLPPILTYDSKADPDSPYWDKLTFKQAELDEVTRAQMIDHCAVLFHRLGFRDYARIDFRAGADGQPRMIDANTNPTWYFDGKMAIMAGWAGYSYAQMLGLILDAAVARYGLRG